MDVYDSDHLSIGAIIATCIGDGPCIGISTVLGASPGLESPGYFDRYWLRPHHSYRQRPVKVPGLLLYLPQVTTFECHIERDAPGAVVHVGY